MHCRGEKRKQTSWEATLGVRDDGLYQLVGTGDVKKWSESESLLKSQG